MPDRNSIAGPRAVLMNSVTPSREVASAPGGTTLWTPQKVSEETGASVSALAKGRMGIGPLASLRYVRLGARRVAYRPADVLAWIETRMTRSTAEAKAQREMGR